MKKCFVCALAAIALASVVVADENLGTKKTEEKATSEKTTSSKSYVGQYDEKMTPENSVVIFFAFPGTEHAIFKQINPKFPVDEQEFKYDLLEAASFTIFKPVKPGSRYMITKMKGTMGDGFQRSYWNMDFKPNQQVLVLDIPTEPGVYCFGNVWGESVAVCAQKGEAYRLQKVDQWYWGKKWYTPKVYKQCLKKFKARYDGTPWVAAYEEKMKNLKQEPLEETSVEDTPAPSSAK